ncbi:MAG: DUF3068 domain-containing protein [Gammaproteobacteria bacterium]|nr:DUF3068 domain-containing protein [Gammaproteobacteria bacterium]
MSTLNPLSIVVSPVRFFSQKKCWLGAAAFWMLAVLLRWGIAPYYEKIPADYFMETQYTAKLWSRQTPASDAVESDSMVRRRDQTLTRSAAHSIIQGDAHWLTATGILIFETLNTYGVDRRTRQNLTSYGDQERTGQYLFPPHTLKQQYDFWDPIYAGPNRMTFAQVDRFRDIEVYVFDSRAEGLDETAGYRSSPDVPEKYRVLTYGKGRLWVEPVSGVVVDHEDGGTSYYVELKSGRYVGEPINQWYARYTPETIQAQLQFAKTSRRWMLALEVWLPLTFVTTGLFCIAAAFFDRYRAEP